MDPLVIVSNRGPASAKVTPSGDVILSRGGGGLVSALSPLAQDGAIKWCFPISSQAELDAQSHGLFGRFMQGLEPIEVAPDVYDAAYNDISNKVLWYLTHGMFQTSRNPSFDSVFYLSWKKYLEYSSEIAKSVAEIAPKGARIILQDYHMFMVAHFLAPLRPDSSLAMFLHTPFSSPSELDVLPNEIAKQILESLSNLDHLGFHAAKWQQNYLDCVSSFGANQAKHSWVNPLGTDAIDIVNLGNTPQVEEAADKLGALANGRRIIARIDRMEPSKNILRGIDSIVEMYKFYPYLLATTVHFANCYPSREAIPDYGEYAREVHEKVESANKYLRELARPLKIELESDPIVLFSEDNFALSLAILRSYDVLLVNPIRDGLNLVASEGTILNEHDGVLVLSKNAGVAEIVSEIIPLVNPFDIKETALAISQSLALNKEQRKSHNSHLKTRFLEFNPQLWLSNQINWFNAP
ncbi:trehalose-6-phosphate synthase [Acidithrix sp. C25]|uniref:trehalose-6-phosphate synthase n=1 Tax=Acidithrix sp. C25 TaxID=1671482 RepID=UPI00191BC768|nr:trehalose-6-phosphate synthase [Acidithrix sp. C25]CAG4917998.1 unnamed protein product [Acidithrix sp. C25]